MNFLIQCKEAESGSGNEGNLELLFDYQMQIIDSIRAENWLRQERVHSYTFDIGMSTYDYTNHVPIGSVEFTLEYYKKYYNIDNILPINIPSTLSGEKYTGREIGSFTDFYSPVDYNPDIGCELFYKSKSQIKGDSGFIDQAFIDGVENYDDMVFSKCIDIESEWRGFVYEKELLDCRCYSGRFEFNPDYKQIYKMIDSYTDAPRAYTIDVMVNKDGTYILECHQFFACGLYGFMHNKLLRMIIDTHRDILNS